MICASLCVSRPETRFDVLPGATRCTLGGNRQRFEGRYGPVRTTTAPQDRVLDAAGAASLLHVSTKTVMKLARAGELPGRKVGREWRFETAALLDHVAGRHSA